MDSNSIFASPERNRACRLRIGRGGRRHLDRRLPGLRLPHRRSHSSDSESDDGSDLERRWKYDQDDEPAVGPDGPDEHDRVLIDDYDARYVFCKMYMTTMLIFAVAIYLTHRVSSLKKIK
jgi:enhancer of polycomb-like protein